MFFGREHFLGPINAIHLMSLQLHGAMFSFEKWNFRLWKVSAAASLHGCGLTACHISETDASWVFGQTSFPSFEVESTWVRTLGHDENLALDYVVGFLGESYRVAVFIPCTTAQKLTHTLEFLTTAKPLPRLPGGQKSTHSFLTIEIYSLISDHRCFNNFFFFCFKNFIWATHRLI